MGVSEAWRHRPKMPLSSRPRRREHTNRTGQPDSIDAGIASAEVADGGPQRFHAVRTLECSTDIWQQAKCRGPRICQCGGNGRMLIARWPCAIPHQPTDVLEP